MAVAPTQDAKQYLRPEAVAKLRNMEVRARLVVEGFITGLHRSPYHGFSVEFAEHRPYMPGDEIRHIDWKVYGKTGRYYIKEYEEETNLKTTLLVDQSASMGYASPGKLTKLAYASYLAASLCYLMMRQQDAVGLALFSESVDQHLPPHLSRAYLTRLLAALEAAKPARTTGIGPALHAIAAQLNRRGLIVVLSDLFDDPATILAGLKHFRHRQHEVVVFQILDPMERSFAFPGGAATVFEDMETGETIQTDPVQMRRAYQTAMTEFVTTMQRDCRAQGIDHVLLDTTTPFDVALVDYLVKRRRIGG